MADEQKPMQKMASVDSVLSSDKAMRKPAPKKEGAKDSKSKGKKHKHTHIEHHYDEQGNSTGHTVRHTPQGGGEDVSYAAPDMDAVHDGLEQHVGEANGDEGQEQAQAAPDAAPAAAAAQPQAAPAPAQGA